MKRLKIIVHGHVQGVGFRMFVHREASSGNLSGWTRNRPDGTVEIEAQGDNGNLEKLAQSVKTGPGRAMVKSIAVREIEPLPSEAGFHVLS